ncbi:hypothetical protein [Flavobacterium sp. NKUCC04_CG]|uniref:hypothetical protein n=1 Tax=Flavobacterium sp. NKUCC04_CG TaxID=2842121 RepID=UPI001C5BF6AB|nr:hypothetical protein [Flavobacterium sp. NKUCC04_CG]MBW3518637.1 hypothetical protein [Flavobacterium sp. NKUCC04_CG]
MNFEIKNSGEISNEFLKLGIQDFTSACKFISLLPYKRNSNKENVLCVFEDSAGTCSTKHSTLRKLALENNKPEIKLILGIFKMDANYAPKIKKTLEVNYLNYIPEAHNYLKIGSDYFDFTNLNSSYSEVENLLLIETEIEFDEINHQKIQKHKEFLSNWIKDKPQFNLEQIWKIRESCITDLQN